MAKFSGASVKAGQTDALTQEAAAAGPVQQLQDRVPQASEPQSFAELMEETPEATPEEIAVQEQVESERIPTEPERKVDESPKDFPIVTKPKLPTVDGGLEDRASNMAQRYTSESPLKLSPRTPLTKAVARGTEVDPGPEALAQAEAEAVKNPGSLLAAFNRTGGVQNSFNEETRSYETTIDPILLSIGSAVVENFFAGDAYESIDPETGQFVEQEIDLAKVAPVTRAQGNERLGKEINREYRRIRNAQEGKPTDQYTDLPNEEANTLGHAFKKMYADLNSDLVEEITVPGQPSHFQITAKGIDQFPLGSDYRKKLFPKVQVRPSKVATKSGQLPGEVGKTVVRKQTGAVKRKHVDDRVLREATRNLNEVANVVDKQRMKILYTTTLPVLSGAMPEGDPLTAVYGDMNNVGPDKMSEFNAAQETAVRNKKKYDAEKQMEQERYKLAQQLRAVAMERKGANHLTYFIQSATGRITPQQLYFNPTTAKAVRFVTRNVVPAKASPNSRVSRNLEQMYAMMLVPDEYAIAKDKRGKHVKTEALLPEHRIEAFNRAAPRLEAWGDRLAEVLEQTMTDEHAEAVSEAIEAGTALDDPNFPQVQPLALDPSRDAGLIAAIAAKGDDGGVFIDGVIDAAKYIKAKREGRPHHSYFNAYVDGKTNGIASNALQVGSLELAKATGVIRSKDSKVLLDEGDIRDQLAKDLQDRLRGEGFPGNTEDISQNLYTVAEVLFDTRNLNKATTMTFPYGKELASFKDDIEEYLDKVYQKELGKPYALALDSLRKDMGNQKVVETLHRFYIGSLAAKMDSQAIANRKIMRTAATLHAITDQLFTIKSATGFEVAMGGTLSEGFDAETQTTYEYEGQPTQRVGQYKGKPTSAAEKFELNEETGQREGTPGQLAYGQSVTSPIQSLDAATVALSASGASWKKLKDASNGNPYMHTIYDAFKLDAMGFDVGVREVNKNWFDAGMNWSYLEETLKSTKEKLVEWKKEMNNIPKDQPMNVGPDGEYRMVGYLLSGPKELTSKLKNLLPDDGDPQQAAKVILDNMRQHGYTGGNTMTRAQLELFYDLFQKQVQLSKRLTAAINETNERKKALRKAAQDNPILQYYAH